MQTNGEDYLKVMKELAGTMSPQNRSQPDGPHLPIQARHRVLLVCSHVVQYASPIFRQMAQDPRFDVLVAYCSMQGAETGIDPGFGVPVSWDQPQLDGYNWTHPANCAAHARVDRFWGLFNPGLWKLIREGHFDAVWLNGYFYASAWIGICAAKRFGVPILFSSEAHSLQSWAAQSQWRMRLKRIYVRRILSLAEVLLPLSSGAAEQLKRLGFPANRITPAPYVVDNTWWSSRAEHIDRDEARTQWGLSPSAFVILFSAKLQPWKGPQDLLEAFARANLRNGCLVFAGDGPLRGTLERRSAELGISERVRFLGFLNQSQLPSIYCAADLLVLPSLYEPFGLVVNEAMLCGCPVAVSDRVGAKFDLVRERETGWIFPCGNIAALESILVHAVAHPQELNRMGEAARSRMESWSPREYLDALAEAMRVAGACRS